MKYNSETTAYLEDKGFENPEIAIILGTGLGQLIQKVLGDVLNLQYNLCRS
jgi:purine-nucleoside phosphorylase